MDVKNNIANNIVELRKSKKWTQAELAEKLNYTDKAISKWERGESTPDVDVLYKMSEIFGVTVDFFFHDDSFSKIKNYSLPKNILITKMAMLTLIMLAIWLLAIIIFVYNLLQDISTSKQYWVSFVWPVPICLFISIVYLLKIKITKPVVYLSSLFVWTLLASIYLTSLVLGNNIWLIFLVGIPLQAAIITTLFIKK